MKHRRKIKLNNTQKATEKSKSSINRNGSNIYLEESCFFKVEDETAYCQKCKFKTDDYFEAEDHWYKEHCLW